MASIEHDMGTKPGSNIPSVLSQHQSHHLPEGLVKQGGYGTTLQRNPGLIPETTPTPMPTGSESISVNRIGNPSYYDSSMATTNTPYTQLGYTDLGQAATASPTTGTSNIQSSYMPVTDEPPHQYIYAATTAATTAQMGHHSAPGNSPPQVSTAHNPMTAYNSQGAPAQPHPPGGGGWMAPSVHAINTVPQHVHNGGNTWHEWTNAISVVDSSSQDRYNANGLITLGTGQRAPGVAGGGGGGGGMDVGGPDAGVPVRGVPLDHAEQWPMLIYNPNFSGMQL